MLRRSAFLPSLLLCSLSAQVLAQSPFAKPHTLPEDRSQGAAAVDLKQCQEWLYTLASPEYEGRQTGQPGFLKAAEYLTAHFRKLGLEARGEDGSYYQTVPWTISRIQHEESFLSFHRGEQEVLRIPTSRLVGSVTTAHKAAGDVVLLVVKAPQLPSGTRRLQVPPIEGMEDLQVAGKVVLVYIQAPEGASQRAALARVGVQQSLSGKEAAAIVFVQDAPVQGGIRERSGAGRRAGNPAITGSRRRPLDLTFGGDDLAAVLQAAELKPEVLAGDVLQPAIVLQAKLELQVKEEQAPAMNVWAVLPGSDPKLRDEYVVVGSHLDHIGITRAINPGADDDASGTTGVMAVAQMFAKNPVKPKRSILFVCFAGEEDGLIGSDFFAKNSPVPLSSMVAELQMDMIGRDEEENVEGNRGEKAEDNRTSLHLVGTQKLAPALHELCLAKNAAALFDIEYDQEGMFGRSDHANFAKYGVPIAFFFTGLHRDYHQPTDTPDKIHYEKLLRVAHYVYDIAFELAQQAGRPEVDADLWQKYRSKATPQPAAPLRRKDD
jgi:hypothetical protein